MHIAMIGAGYVGLVTGACLADFGHNVVCIERDPNKIEGLNAGRMPIFELGLDILVKENVDQGRLAFRSNMREAVAEAEAVFIAVGTPSRRGDGFADMTFVRDAAREIVLAVTGFKVVVTKSTVPVGEGDAVERIIRETKPDVDFAVVSNPEFLREGAAINDFKWPNRIIIGVENARAETVVREVYRRLYLNQAPILVTERRIAELTKYAANAVLATKITFINKIADLCEEVCADVREVAQGIGLDNRIGSRFLHAGPGYGGSCFPKDTLALVKTAQDAGTPVRLVETVLAVNDQRKRAMARKVIKACGGGVRGETIALLGLTFKPDTDDMRDASSLAIVAGLQDGGAKVRAYDPEGMQQAQLMLSGVKFADNAYACAEGADALVIVTEWNALPALDLDRLRSLMAAPVLVDLLNIYNPRTAGHHSFQYTVIGRCKSSES